jgi:ketosteroid isomerase-like protein
MEERVRLPSGPPGVARIFAQAWDAFARRDVAAFREFITDDIEFHGALGRIDAATHHGRAEMEAWFREIWDAWDEIKALPEQVIEIRDHVLCITRLEGRGRASGAELARPMYQVGQLRDGRLAYLRHTFDAAEALHDLAQRVES